MLKRQEISLHFDFHVTEDFAADFKKADETGSIECKKNVDDRDCSDTSMFVENLRFLILSMKKSKTTLFDRTLTIIPGESIFSAN